MLRYIENPDFAKQMGNEAKRIKVDLGHQAIMNKWEILIEKLSSEQG